MLLKWSERSQMRTFYTVVQNKRSPLFVRLMSTIRYLRCSELICNITLVMYLPHLLTATLGNKSSS